MIANVMLPQKEADDSKRGGAKNATVATVIAPHITMAKSLLRLRPADDCVFMEASLFVPATNAQKRTSPFVFTTIIHHTHNLSNYFFTGTVSL